ncbi:MAG TPA: tetratricopeptide repeat protein [Sedimentisphaerales bacterium]|nr:tetratricopeptide repeat protein [Sedimentisphaerales bacterium]
MGKLLEILGKAITVNTADLILHWLNTSALKHQTAREQLQQLNEIIQLLNTGKADTALERLRGYLFTNSDCLYARMLSAAIYLDMGRLQSAFDELMPVYSRQPSNTMALYALGHCCERLGRQDEAVQFYQDCLKFKNYLQPPRQRLAAIYFKNGQLEKTISEYELLRNEYPDDLPTLLMLGYLYIAAGQYNAAIEMLNTAILIQPDNFYQHDQEVEQLIAEGRLDQAAEKLQDILTEHCERVDLIVRHADVLNMIGAVPEATAEYERASRISPHYLEAAIKLGTQYMHLQSEQQAGRQFTTAVVINDQIVDAYIGLAVAHKLTGQPHEALGLLSLAAAIDANSTFLFAQAAALKILSAGTIAAHEPAQGDHNALIKLAINAHQRHAAIRPYDPDVHYRLAVLSAAAGRFNNAIDHLSVSLRINPTYTRAAAKLAVCLFETNHHNRALEKLPQPEPLDAQTLDLHYRTALLYCDKLTFASSLLNLRNTMDANLTATDATVNISITLQNLGLLDTAAVAWENLAETVSAAMGAPRDGQTQ